MRFDSESNGFGFGFEYGFGLHLGLVHLGELVGSEMGVDQKSRLVGACHALQLWRTVRGYRVRNCHRRMRGRPLLRRRHLRSLIGEMLELRLAVQRESRREVSLSDDHAQEIDCHVVRSFAPVEARSPPGVLYMTLAVDGFRSSSVVV